MDIVDKVITELKHHKWFINLAGEIRDEHYRCPLAVLTRNQSGFHPSITKHFKSFGGTHREAWVIMSAADNLIGVTKGNGQPWSPHELETCDDPRPITCKEVKEMQDRLIAGLMPHVMVTK